MKTKSLLLAAALVAAFSVDASAFSPKESAQPAPRVIPSSVVSLSNLPPSFVTSVVDVEFTLDAKGQPRNIKVRSTSDKALQRQVIAAFSQWRFEGATQPNSVDAKRYVMPIEIRADS
jgi:TonB family protein